MARWTRGVAMGAGFMCVALGLAGLAVPILPTTPFLLLAAFLFARSAPRAHRWLLENRLFGDYVRRYVERRAMRRAHKMATLALLWVAIGASIALATDHLWLRLLLGAVAVGVSVHILSIRSE